MGDARLHKKQTASYDYKKRILFVTFDTSHKYINQSCTSYARPMTTYTLRLCPTADCR